MTPLVFCACIGPNDDGRVVTVFAAASLKDVFGTVDKTFRDTHPEISLRFNFAGSSGLATQLGEGARADVFASADARQMDRAVTAGAIVGLAESFAVTRLGLIVRKDSKRIRALRDIANEDIRIAAAAPEVPAGAYMNETLKILEADPGYGPNFVESVEENLVTLTTNVRLAIATVQLREAHVAFGYTTDVVGPLGRDLYAIEIPEQFTHQVEYQIAVVEGSDSLKEAHVFIDFLRKGPGRTVLSNYGFEVP